ncbi:MAG TPA: dTDP-4-dehydrorhamnose reductase [Chitinophagaceae bacterium]|nr:dTDP-4-dehydrorhamnose reductase [Chitinophagaceae bacterium]
MMANATILVTGSGGQLGQEFRHLASVRTDRSFVFVSRDELDIADAGAVGGLFRKHQPSCCINCAAYTAVDRAEQEPEEAFRVNATAVDLLAQACRSTGARFIHFSTDYVFDGQGREPYREEDPTHPLGVYGASKLQGEQRALAACPDSLVIRTSWVYSPYGRNFVKTMLRLQRERSEIGVVHDQLGSPTYAADLAEATLSILEAPAWHPGLFHYCNEGVISWFDLAVAIGELAHTGCRVRPIETRDYPTPARRPAYSALDTSRIRQVFGIRPPAWRASLARCLRRLEPAL